MRIAAPPGLISPSDRSPFRRYGALLPLPLRASTVRKTLCRHGRKQYRLFQTRYGKRCRSPLSRSRDEIAPRTPKTGTCHPHQSKSFTGRGGPGEGDAFSKAPSSPGKYPASSVKTYAPASASASPAASSEAGPARGASATERSGICHCPGRGAVSSAFSPT